MLRTPIVLGLGLLVIGLLCLATTVYQVKVGETNYHMSPVTEKYEWRSRNFGVTIIGLELVVAGIAFLLFPLSTVFREIASNEKN